MTDLLFCDLTNFIAFVIPFSKLIIEVIFIIRICQILAVRMSPVRGLIFIARMKSGAILASDK